MSEQGPPGGGRVLWALAVDGFLSKLGFGMISFTLPLYALTLGMNLVDVGLLGSMRGLSVIALKPVAGRLAGRFGVRATFLAAVWGRVLTSALFLASGSPFELMLIRGLHGATVAARDPTAATMLATSASPDRVARHFSWYTTARDVGGALGYSAAGASLALTGRDYRLSFACAIFVSILSALVVVALLPRTAGSPNLEDAGPDETSLACLLMFPDPLDLSGITRGMRALVRRDRRRKVAVEVTPLRGVHALTATGAWESILESWMRRNVDPSAQPVLFLWHEPGLPEGLRGVSVPCIVGVPDEARARLYIGLPGVRVCLARSPWDVCMRFAALHGAGPDAFFDPASVAGHRRGLWPLAGLGASSAAVAQMAYSMFPVLAVHYAHLSEAQAGLILTGSALVLLVSGPAFGWLSDRLGRNWPLTFRSAAGVASSVLYWLDANFTGLLVGRLVDDAGKGAFRPTWSAMMTRDEHGQVRSPAAIADLDTAYSAGEVIGPLLAGWLWQSFGLGPMLAVRGMLSVGSEIMARLLTPQPGGAGLIEEAPAAEPVAGLPATQPPVVGTPAAQVPAATRPAPPEPAPRPSQSTLQLSHLRGIRPARNI